MASDFGPAKTLACALKTGCAPLEGVCMPVGSARAALVADDAAALEREFDASLERDVAARKAASARALRSAVDRVGRLRLLITSRHLAVQRSRKALGDAADLRTIERSPHASLRDTILAQGDFAKRQANIGAFVARFTRSAAEGTDEDPWWLYCADSGLKLLPSFLASLADAFLSDQDYLAAARQICATRGTISDDGEAWVDKYSGYAIVPIDYDDDEGYTEAGFRIQTRAVLEVDLDDGPVEATGAERFSDPFAREIAAVSAGLGRFLGVSVDSSLEFVVRTVRDRLAATMPSQAKYDELVKARKARGKTGIEEYSVFKSRTLVIVTSAVTLFAIQTQVPPPVVTRRHPGCPQSFEGYPVGDSTDLRAIKYVACVLRSLAKGLPPWDALDRSSSKDIAKQMAKYLGASVVGLPESMARIAERSEFERLHPARPSGLDANLQAWVNFLPPLTPVAVKRAEGLTPALQRTIEAHLRTGSRDQTLELRRLRGRVIRLGLEVLDLVEKAVGSEGLRLATAGGDPFLENACCDQKPDNPLEYVASKEPRVLRANEEASRARDFLDDMGTMARAPMLFDPADTRRRFPAPPPGFSDNTVYQAFIVMCKLTTSTPPPTYLQGLCLIRPNPLPPDASLERYIDILKSEGHNYTQASLAALMQAVNRQNIVTVKMGQSPVPVALDIIETLGDETGPPLPDGIAALLTDALQNSSDENAARALRNTLAEESAKNAKTLDEFLRSGPANRASEAARKCIASLLEQSQSEEGGLTFMKQCVHQLTRVFPNIVLTELDYEEVDIPAHWNLSTRHEEDVQGLIARYYQPLIALYGRPRLAAMLAQYTHRVRGYGPLVDRLFIAKQLDQRTNALLSSYLLSACMTEVVEMSTRSPEVLDAASAAANAALGTEPAAASDLGEQEALARDAASFLVSSLTILCHQASSTRIPYDELMQKVHRAREREKDLYTSKLGALTDEERHANMQLKVLKLGDWGKGTQKGMRTYQGETYDQEVEEMEAQALAEFRMGESSLVTDMNRDIYAMEDVARQAEADRIEAEEMNMAHLADDDDYGDRDGDEHY